MKLMSFFFLSIWAPLLSAQTIIQTYEEARESFFWDVLYEDGGETLYCGRAFTSRTGLNVEHVYPAGWIASHFGCFNRDHCPVDQYHFAAADLHNLWPSVGIVNQDRSNLHFGTIKGEGNRVREDLCADFEMVGSRAHGIVEPRDSVKGDIARTMFYMELAYGLPLKRMRKMLVKWDKADPVDAEELRRNKVIRRIQKRGNPFIGRMEAGEHVRLEPTAY